jgi:hypothetical protein
MHGIQADAINYSRATFPCTPLFSNSQSFELLMTFYTPDTYLGPPGSSQAVQVVSAEDVPRE